MLQLSYMAKAQVTATRFRGLAMLPRPVRPFMSSHYLPRSIFPVSAEIVALTPHGTWLGFRHP
jgi:hypothetical protein